MAQWRKVIVSGSSAELSSLTLDTALPVAQGGIGATSLTDKAVLISQDSGTDAVGALALTTNGSIIVGGTNGPAVEAASDVAGTGLTATTGDGTLVINVDASQTQITDVGTLDTGAISSGFGNIDNGTSTLNTGNATVDTLVNDSSVAASRITGSFTGSFVGDGSGLVGTGLDVDTLSNYGAQTIHQTDDHLLISDDGTEKKITFSDLEDSIFANISGDATVAGGGALTIAADSVEGTMLNTNAADTTTIELSSDTLSVLKVPNSLTVDNSSIELNSGTTYDGSAGRTISVKDGGITNDMLAGSIANGKLANSSITVGGTATSLGGTVTGAHIAAALNSDLGGNVSFGNQSSDTVTFAGGVTVDGNLDVNGSLTTIDSTNLRVTDRFIQAASGSTSGDGGFIVSTGANGVGTAFGYDDSAKRWGLTKEDDTAHDATSISPRQFVVSVSGSAANPADGDNPNDFGTGATDRIGMMHVNTSDGTIWIYS